MHTDFAKVLLDIPVGNHSTACFRGLLVALGKLAENVSYASAGSPVQTVFNFVDLHFADDGYLVNHVKSRLQSAFDDYAAGRRK